MLSNLWTSIQVMAGSAGADATVAVRPMRILIFDLLPAVPYYTGHLAAALSDTENVRVRLGSATYTHDRGFFRRMGVRNRPGLLDVAYRVPVAPLRRPLKLLECLLNMAALALQFLKSKPNIIHVQFTPLAERRLPFELWFLKFARALGIRLVYTVHNVLPHDASSPQVCVYRRLYQLIDQFICHDVHAKARLSSEFGIEPARISVIPHGPLFARDGSEKSIRTPAPTDRASDGCIVLCQGIVRPYKGIPFLLRVWKAAREAGLQGGLWIVGTGDKPMLKQIEEDAAALGIASSVHLDFRFVSVEQLAAYYEAADILVYPYTRITTSGALMTGIGHGKAIIASVLPAFEQVLHHEKNALLAPYGDVGAWTSALLRLASDPDLRSRLASRLADGRAVSPCWTEIASQTCRAYQQLLPSLRVLNFSGSSVRQDT
jgi:glycosyltransferase involved in cell wall biosynthesis